MKSKKLATIFTALFLLGTAPSVKASTVSNYTVKAGDSLWKIAKAYNTTISKIASLNNIDPNKYIYVGQTLKIEMNNTNPQEVKTVNYKTVSGDTIWGIAEKYGTTIDTIVKSNMLAAPILMPGQIITVPVNSNVIVKPVGITMLKSKKNNTYGDIYTWENARRIFTVGQNGTLKDLNTGITFNIKYYGGSNHSDIVPLTKTDTAKMEKIYSKWSWSAMRPMVLTFNQGGTNYQLAVSVTGMPHSTTDMYAQNGIDGHFDMYFYNSTSHNTNKMNDTHQKNILTANGQ